MGRHVRTRTKYTQIENPKNVWNLNRRFGKKNYRINSIHRTSDQAERALQSQRKKHSARVVKQKKIFHGYNLYVTSGHTKGRYAVYTRPKKQARKGKKRK